MPILANIKALILDVDGTLVRLPIDYPELRSALETYFLQWGVEAELRPILKGVDEASMKASSGSEEAYRDIRSGAMRIIDNTEMMAAPASTLLPGARELLSFLPSTGRPFGLCTRNASAAVRAAFDAVGLPMPKVCVGRGDIPNELLKPDPRHPLEVLRHLGTNIQPGDACIVGDSDIDAASSRSAGMMSVLVSGEGEADLVVPDLYALIEMLQE